LSFRVAHRGARNPPRRLSCGRSSWPSWSAPLQARCQALSHCRGCPVTRALLRQPLAIAT